MLHGLSARAGQERAGLVAGRAADVRRPIDRALEGRAGLVRVEFEDRGVRAGRILGPGVDDGVRLARRRPDEGRRVVGPEAAVLAGRRRIHVRGWSVVERAHPEPVLAGAESFEEPHGAALLPRRGRCRRRSAAPRALERLDGLVAGEAEGDVGAGVGRIRVDDDEGLGRRRVLGPDDQPLVEVGRNVSVAVGIDRAYMEDVDAATERAGDRVRGGARRELALVERALELIDGYLTTRAVEQLIAG